MLKGSKREEERQRKGEGWGDGETISQRDR